MPFPETGQPLDIACAGEHQAAFQPGVGLCFHPGFGKGLLQSLRRGLLAVDLYHRIRGLVVGDEHGFQSLAADIAFQLVYQCLGVAVTIHIAFGALQRPQLYAGSAQHRIDQGVGPGLLFTVFFRQDYGFVYRSRGRDSVHFQHLVKAQMENIPHRGVKLIYLAGKKLL